MKNIHISLMLSILILLGTYLYTTEVVARESRPALLSSSDLPSLNQEEMETFFQFLTQNEEASQFVEGFGIKPVLSSSEAKISGVVYHDLNRNGEMEENEDGISGVKITLKKLAFYWFWLYFKTVASTTTDEDGFYQFEQPAWNIYLLIEEDLPECTSTTSNTRFLFLSTTYGTLEINFGDYCEGGPIECTYYYDADGDGYGNPDESVQYPCSEQPPSWIEDNTDCDDTNLAINPAATEVCDGVDNDCDGATDEDLGTTTCGLGVCEHTAPNCLEGVAQVCDPFEGASEEICDGVDNDCDGTTDEDLGATTCGVGECKRTVDNCVDGVLQECTPGEPASEVCDGVDNDCDEDIDEGVMNTYYRDVDGDTYGNPADTIQACQAPAGYVEDNTDCDDTKGEINPEAAEDCTDGVDNDCNNLADNSDPACQPVCTDADGDGFCIEGGACGIIDCDDDNSTIYPGAPEECEDGVDQNCSGEDLLCILVDNDGDLWAASQGDCDDSDPTIFPGATDFPGDGVDQDCDGADDPVPSVEDFDHDGITYADGD